MKKKKGNAMRSIEYTWFRYAWDPDGYDLWVSIRWRAMEHLKETLTAMIAERRQLIEQGFHGGWAATAFLNTALQNLVREIKELDDTTRMDDATRFENGELKDADKRECITTLRHALTKILQDAKYYADADLSWSAIWESFDGEYGEMLANIRRYLTLGDEDSDSFICCTQHPPGGMNT